MKTLDDTIPFMTPVSPENQDEVPFVDRLTQRAALDEELARASNGHARVVLLTGEIGIGKSRLWEEWSRELDLSGGATPLQARCLATTQSVPLAPLADLFSHSAFRQEHRRGTQGFLAPTSDLLATFEAYVQHLLEIEARPLVIFIDDLQWADDTTLEWLSYAVHRLHQYPLLLVAAYQPESVSAGVARLVAGWLREGLVRRLALGRLSPDDSQALVTAVGCPPGMVEQVLSLGMGNPYFLIELCKGAQDTPGIGAATAPTYGIANAAPGVPGMQVDVPPALAEIIRTRLDRLPDSARDVAVAAAILPPTFHFSALWQVSGQGEVETVDALDTLLQAGLLREEESSYAFAYPLFGAAVRGELSEARRELLRRRLAGLLSGVDTQERHSWGNAGNAFGAETPWSVDRLPSGLEGAEQVTMASGHGHSELPVQAQARLDTDDTRYPLVEPLSDRELEVLQLLSQGASNAEIAGQLVVAVNTVKRHVSNIFEKLGTTNRTQAVAQARALGLLDGWRPAVILASKAPKFAAHYSPAM